VSRAVSRLEEMGIVSRRLDAQDSRVQHIDILPGNEALLRDVAQAYRGVNDMIYRNISDEEIAAFRATAGRIADNMAAALADERLAATQAEDDPQ
jgi:DNA-binding MarR family transcriptional regulator